MGGSGTRTAKRCGTSSSRLWRSGGESPFSMGKTEYKRLTVEEVTDLCERHGVKLKHGDYGFRPSVPNAGCAVSMLLLRHLDDPAKTSEAMESLRCQTKGVVTYVAKECKIPANYVNGLEIGFEASSLSYGREDEDFLAGHEDGLALRDLETMQQ